MAPSQNRLVLRPRVLQPTARTSPGKWRGVRGERDWGGEFPEAQKLGIGSTGQGGVQWGGWGDKPGCPALGR